MDSVPHVVLFGALDHGEDPFRSSGFEVLHLQEPDGSKLICGYLLFRISRQSPPKYINTKARQESSLGRILTFPVMIAQHLILAISDCRCWSKEIQCV